MVRRKAVFERYAALRCLWHRVRVVPTHTGGTRTVLCVAGLASSAFVSGLRVRCRAACRVRV
eukprot:58848-Prymnesium_polylepis.1